jgi:hypothetical protein
MKKWSNILTFPYVRTLSMFYNETCIWNHDAPESVFLCYTLITDEWIFLNLVCT